MKCPGYLEGEAKVYWLKHAKRLIKAGLLTSADTESFALLCSIWGLLRGTDINAGSQQAIRYMALITRYIQLAKQFALMPKDRIKAKLDTEPDDEPDEFGL